MSELTLEEYKARIKQLEEAIRHLNKQCDEYEGTSLLQFCLSEQDEYYEIVKAVIQPQ